MTNLINEHASVIRTPARVASSLRGLVSKLAQDGASAEPVLIGQHGKPEAVLMSFSAYQELMTIAAEADAKALSERLAGAPQPGSGLSTKELWDQVAAAHSDDEAGLLRPGIPALGLD